MPLSWGETSKPAFSSAFTRKRRMSLSSSARRILCMGFDRRFWVTGSLHSLSPADGKFRVKDAGRDRLTGGDLTASGAGRKAIKTTPGLLKEAFQGKRAFFTWQGARDFPQYAS